MARKGGKCIRGETSKYIYIHITFWLVDGMQPRGGWLVEMIDVLTASLEGGEGAASIKHVGRKSC